MAGLASKRGLREAMCEYRKGLETNMKKLHVHGRAALMDGDYNLALHVFSALSYMELSEGEITHETCNMLKLAYAALDRSE